MSQTIPPIDLAALHGGDPLSRKRLARAIDEACRDIGFLLVKGHGVSPSLIDGSFEAARFFFDSSPEKKRSVEPTDARVRGFTPIGAQGLAYSLNEATPPDLFERFRMGRCEIPDDEYHRARAATYFAPNLWPAFAPGFREALSAYYAAMERLAADLMASFALALELPERFFDDRIDRHISSLCLNHYPSQPEAPLPRQLRAGAHTDYGSLTIVAPTAAPGGLQVRARDGTWIDVEPAPGEFVVNIGDLMAQWTNDRWVSTLHRVANPAREVADDSRRISLVFFHQPNEDAVVECLPHCSGAGNAARYAPVTSGEHLTTKLRRSFAMKSRSA
jgi:isopenicillin N synthase-like dioxygenase